MSEMVERVARAAYEKFNEGLLDQHGGLGLEPAWEDLESSFKDRMIEAQRAAIEAMREPTGRMLMASATSRYVKHKWQAMIDEALR